MSTWETVTWNVARAGGLTAYVLLTLSVVLGLALSLRWQRPHWPRLITNELHSFMTLLSLVFIGVHVLAILVDPYTHFGLSDILIPLATYYKPVWMAFGIVAAYLALAVWISTQMRPRIGYALWRRLHTLTFGVYLLSTIHGITIGSDAHTAWAAGLYAGSLLLVGLLIQVRLLAPTGTHGKTYPTLATIAGFLTFGGVAWSMAGLLLAPL